MHRHNCPDFDMGEVAPGDPAMGFCLCDPINLTQKLLAEKPCEVGPCSVCEGLPHHWMPDCDEDNGQPVLICKHCDARRPYATDEELEDEEAIPSPEQQHGK